MAHFIEFLILQFTLWFFRLFPLSFMVAFGRGFGSFLYAIGLRKKVVMTNLQIAFGKEKSPEEIEKICKSTFRNMGSQLFEFLMLQRVKPERLGDFVTLHGKEVMDAALKEGKGVTLAGNHFGHWELLSAAVCHFAHPFHGYAGKQYNPLVDDLINQIRGKFGMRTISKSKRATREMITLLKKNGVLGILGDLNVPKMNLFVDFFGLKAAVGEGLATFTVKGKHPLLFIWIRRVDSMRHEAFIERLDYESLMSGDEPKDIATVAQLIVSRLEENIKAYPDHYFWFNRRFKTRPENEKRQGVQIYEKMD